MNSDSYFKIGHIHDVCEDFAIASGKDDRSFAIMSDGCSGSPRTDFGARFLTLAMEQILSNEKLTDEEIDQMHMIGLSIAQLISVTSRLNNTCLDATLGYVFPNKENIIAFLAGDGAIAARKIDGSKWAAIIDYPSGAPPYLSYSLDKERLQYYLKETDGCRFTIDIYDGFDTDDTNTKTEKKGMDPHIFTFPRSEYDLVMVMSDGICSFQKPANSETTRCFEMVHPIDIINRFLAVKSYKGDFIKRRCKRFIKNLCTKGGWKHLDDISVAAIYNAK